MCLCSGNKRVAREKEREAKINKLKELELTQLQTQHQHQRHNSGSGNDSPTSKSRGSVTFKALPFPLGEPDRAPAKTNNEDVVGLRTSTKVTQININTGGKDNNDSPRVGPRQLPLSIMKNSPRLGPVVNTTIIIPDLDEHTSEGSDNV